MISGRMHLKKHSGEEPNQCNMCDFSNFNVSTLKRHLKMHSGEKTNKCNQCDYASSRASKLRTYLKIWWRKINKYSQYDYVCSYQRAFRTHLETQGKSYTHAKDVIFPLRLANFQWQCEGTFEFFRVGPKDPTVHLSFPNCLEVVTS